MERSEIEEKYKWNMSDIYPSDEAWEEEFDRVFKSMDFSPYKGKLNSAENLLKYFSYRDGVLKKLYRLSAYAGLKGDEDIRVQKYAAYNSQIQSIFSKFHEQLSFVKPELVSLSESSLKAFISDPSLKDYDYELSLILKQKPHVLSENEERLLALSSEAAGGYQNVFSRINDAELDLPEEYFNGEKIQITHGNYGLVMQEGTAEERRNWYIALRKAYLKKANTLTETYGGSVKADVFYSRARKYNSCLEMSLAGSDVPVSVYDNLIKTVRENLPALHRYISLRKKLFGLSEQHLYDLSVPVVKNADFSLEYNEAYSLVIKGLAPLGKDYQALLKKAHDDRWLDVYENTGKTSGAYSWGVEGVHPYVLLNYTKTIDDIFTIAHEMGHSVHTYKSHAAQPFAKSNYTLFVAEIASTCNEVLLLKYLYNNATDVNLKKYLINYYIDMMWGTLFAQALYAEFEQTVHEKAEENQPLTKDCLCGIYSDIIKRYYGDGVIYDDGYQISWAGVPHFYSAFYVYQYATGIISAISIANRILKYGESAVKDYFKFLSSGGSLPPIEELKLAGVDLTTQQPFMSAMQEFSSALSELEKLI